MFKPIYDATYQIKGYTDENGNIYNQNFVIVGHYDRQTGNMYDRYYRCTGHVD